jgi:hypothetical protein
MKTWQGLTAEEIASIPNDEYRLQKVERILRERNEPRELSDEEINKLWTDSYDFNGRFCVYEFARAILRKAQEK